MCICGNETAAWELRVLPELVCLDSLPGEGPQSHEAGEVIAERLHTVDSRPSAAATAKGAVV